MSQMAADDAGQGDAFLNSGWVVGAIANVANDRVVMQMRGANRLP